MKLSWGDARVLVWLGSAFAAPRLKRASSRWGSEAPIPATPLEMRECAAIPPPCLRVLSTTV